MFFSYSFLKHKLDFVSLLVLTSLFVPHPGFAMTDDDDENRKRKREKGYFQEKDISPPHKKIKTENQIHSGEESIPDTELNEEKEKSPKTPPTPDVPPPSEEFSSFHSFDTDEIDDDGNDLENQPEYQKDEVKILDDQ